MPDNGTFSPLPRIESGITGLDTVLDGGFVAGTTCLVLGPPGSGKTTLGNQVAFGHARAGGTALFTTVLAEPHERMLRRLSSFAFFDPTLIGDRLHYINLLDTLDDEGLDGVLTLIRREIRSRDATLLVVDGMSLVEDLSPSHLELRRFIHRLQAVTSLAGCTTLLLTGAESAESGAGAMHTAGMHADGIIDLALDPLGVRDRRTLRVAKFRGIQHLLGRHDIFISEAGLEIFPRLETVEGRRRAPTDISRRLSTGVDGLDAMLGGGVFQGTTTMLLGTPGSGKTLIGLHVLGTGLGDGERAMFAGFHEQREELATTAARIGVAIAEALEDGRLEVFWRPPLELSPDAWALSLLDAVDRHRPSRLMIDGLSDLHRLQTFPERLPAFLTALTNALRERGVTTVASVEIDTYVGEEVASPVPAISAIADNGVLLRHVEIRSRLHRLVSVLKARQSTTDPDLREYEITSTGVHVGAPFSNGASLLTGAARPEPIGMGSWREAVAGTAEGP